MAKANLKVMLLRATPDPDEVVALGARLCYAQADLDALRERVETTDQQKYIAGVMARGHLSVTEHASFTFAVEGVSRALLAHFIDFFHTLHHFKQSCPSGDPILF